ncbi:DNA/RNA polymerases superfamily protein [Tanacetum coccineum]
MSTTAKNVIATKADNHPPMLEKSQYNSWQSHMKLYIRANMPYLEMHICRIQRWSMNILEYNNRGAHSKLSQYTVSDPSNTCMTMSSNKELIETYNEPERVLHSLRRLFKTTSFDHLSSPEFELFSNYEEQVEEEIIETMTKPTMEECMTKTREDYRSCVARLKFDKDAKFELKGQFLKELRDNTFSGSENEDANEHIERVLEIVDLFTTPNVTQDQLMLCVFPISLTGAASRCGPYYSEDCPLKEEGNTLEEAYYTQFGVPFLNAGRYKAAAPGFYQRENGNPSYQERRHTMEELLKTNIPLIRRIEPNRYAVSSQQKDDKMQLIKLRRASIPFLGRLKEYGYDENEVFKGLKKLQVNSEESATSLKRLLKEKTRIEEEIKATMNEHYSEIIKDDLPPKEKDLESFTLPCKINDMCFDKALADLGASVSVIPYSTFSNLGLGKLAPTKLIIELADKTIKHPKGIAKNVLVGIDKFVFPIDFIILDTPEDIKILLILGRSFLSTAHAKIDVFKRNIAFRIENDKIVLKSDSPTSNIIKRTQDPDFGDFLELNDLNEPLELTNHEIEDLGPTIKEGEFIDEPMIDVVKIRHHNGIVENINEYPNFTVMENMDAYRDKDMGDVIFRKPFCRDACVEARRFDGFITIHNGNDNVTYQIAQSHPRFKHLSNEQCNKIKPLLKVSARDIGWKFAPISKAESTWMAFGGNTRDLGSFGEETDKITTPHQT